VPPHSTAASFIATGTTTTTTPGHVANTQNSIVAQPKLEQKPTPNVLLAAMKPQFSLQMGPPKIETSVAATTAFELASLGPQHQMPRSRLSAVMQVRCKAISAYLYVNKYESGSKGKCILLGEEWLTPNEFEEKSGSKAKKYLSSIKCLGRPLRAFVNSGKLKFKRFEKLEAHFEIEILKMFLFFEDV
jgi:SAND domain